LDENGRLAPKASDAFETMPLFTSKRQNVLLAMVDVMDAAFPSGGKGKRPVATRTGNVRENAWQEAVAQKPTTVE
jgi:hypothetical protein